MCEEGVGVEARRDGRGKGTNEREIPVSPDVSSKEESGHSSI